MVSRLVVVGAISLLAQTVVLRELAVAFYGVELVYALGLGAWLLGTAAGAAFGRRRHVPGEDRLRTVLVAFALVLPAAIVLARALRIVLGGVPGAYLPFGRQMLALALCTVPLSVLGGWLFQGAAKQWTARGRTFASAYAWESAGALAGGLLATALPAAGVSNLAVGLLGGLVAVGTLVRRSILAAGAGGVLLVAVAASARIDRAMTAWTHPSLIATRDTPYGRFTVTERSGQIAVFANDALAHDSEGSAAEEFVLLAAVQRQRPETIAIVGGVASSLTREALRFDPVRVIGLDLDRAVHDVVASHQPEGVRQALADPRVRFVFGDPRRRLEAEGKLDLILVAMPEPDSGGTNRYYTREFFRTCAARLGPRGILALRLRAAENLWTPLAARRAAAVHGALRSVFADVVVLPGTSPIYLASAAPLERDPASLGARLPPRGPEPGLVTPAYVRYLYTNDRFAEIAARLAGTTAPINSDRRPVCYAATMLLWLSRFFPTLGSIDLPSWQVVDLARSPWSWLVLAGALLGLVLARRRDTTRRAVLAGLAGCAGMILECAVLLDYQTRSGVLYRDLGFLMTAFMAGLTLGAAAVDRTGSSAPRRLGVVAAFVLLAAGSSAWLHAGSPGGLAAASLALLAAGFVVAAVVAHAALLHRPDQVAVVSPVYAADLLGGCIGSLLAAFVLIPFAGLPVTALVAAVIIIGAL